MSILVVEDDEGLRDVVVDTLEDEDYEVGAASCVADALKLAKEQSFVLLITDVRMPGPDGVDGFASLRELIPDLKCIIMSGYTDKEASGRAIGIEVEEWLAKPFSAGHLLRAVDRALNSGHWSNHYFELLQKAPVAMLSGFSSLFKRDKLSKLNASRHKAFLALHTAIRSAYLGARGANVFFSELLLLDRDYRQILDKDDEKDRKELASSYEDSFRRLEVLANSKARPLDSGSIPATEFRTLFTAVQTKEVTVGDFKLATILRDIGLEELSKSPDLYQLSKLLWG